jgi:hypothetical protein
MHRRTLLSALLALSIPALLAQSRDAFAEEAKTGTMYKNPECSCCEEYAKYLRDNGYTIKVVATHDLSAIKRQHSVPEQLEGCHTLVIGQYVVEGHVPLKHIDRLLAGKPSIKGISLPGMPQGSPGMTGRKQEPFVIYEIGNDPKKVYATD